MLIYLFIDIIICIANAVDYRRKIVDMDVEFILI